MMAQQQAYAQNLENEAKSEEEGIHQKNWRAKPKKYNGLLEWILERDGHEFLIPVERSFIKDKFNLEGLKEKFIQELNRKENENVDWDRKFNQYIKHLYKAAAPSPQHLQDENYLQFL